MNKYFNILFILCFFILAHSTGQIKTTARGDVRIMFYNVENFFDTIDDPLRNDNEFLPTAQRHWGSYRYKHKLKNVYQVIVAVGEEQPPEIIGFAEIENKNILKDIIYKTPLEKYPYNIIHQESPDQRGIDVGLIYRKDKVKSLYYEFIPIQFENQNKLTRDILYFKALIDKDTVHIFVNHWPSRYGGQQKSEWARKYVASVLRRKIDSVYVTNPRANIIITGDFNDEPQNKSLSLILKAEQPGSVLEAQTLYNLSWEKKLNCKCGTNRFQNEWDMLDQFIVSGNLLLNSEFHVCRDCYHIGDFKFLITEDKKYGGYRPFRTYSGPIYLGGFSDHLPVFLDIYFKW